MYYLLEKAVLFFLINRTIGKVYIVYLQRSVLTLYHEKNSVCKDKIATIDRKKTQDIDVRLLFIHRKKEGLYLASPEKTLSNRYSKQKDKTRL